MNDKQREEYLAAWGDKCFICGSHVEQEDKSIHKAIVELGKSPEHADPKYIQWYLACPSCVEKGELL